VVAYVNCQQPLKNKNKKTSKYTTDAFVITKDIVMSI